MKGQPVQSKRDLAQLIFAAAILLLIALSLWWMVFFLRAVNNEHAFATESLTNSARLHELSLRLQEQAPAAGPLAEDARFHVVKGAEYKGGWKVEPHPDVLRRIEERHQGRKRMWIGEGTLLTGLLLAVVLMLYRLVRAERRFRDEMEEFLSRVTHEMKTPLAGIKAVLQVIADQRVAPEQSRELANKALREVDREHQLIQNLLLAQRLRLPQAPLMREAVDVSALLDQLIQHRRALPSLGHELSLVRPEAATALADPSALQSILDNLLDNATKYGAQRVETVVEACDERVTIAVIDDGEGFNAGDAEGLFEPFQRGIRNGAQGTGLGLHISRALARRMGGDVTGESHGVGQGATFRVTLPLAQPTSTQ